MTGFGHRAPRALEIAVPTFFYLVAESYFTSSDLSFLYFSVASGFFMTSSTSAAPWIELADHVKKSLVILDITATMKTEVNLVYP